VSLSTPFHRMLRSCRAVIAGASWAIIGAGSAAADAVEAIPGMAPVVVAQVEALVDASPEPPPDTAAWTSLTLPDRWSQTRPGFGGAVWYRFAVRFEDAPRKPWALMLPKVTMNADLWINGLLAGRHGSMEDRRMSRHWNTPLLFDTPGSAWRAGLNVVHVRVKADAGHAGGLAPLRLGPAAEVARLHEKQRWLQNSTVAVCSVFVIALGLFFLFVWARHRAQAQYGYFSAAAILWGLSNSNMSVTDVPLPDWHWELLVHVLTLWALLLLCLFGLRFAGRRHARLEAAVLAYAAVSAAIHVAAGERWRIATNAALMLPVLLLGSWALGVVLRYVRQRPLRDHLLFGTAAAAMVAIGVHDWALKAGLLPFERPFALPYIAPVLLSALGWLIAGDYARAQTDLAALNRDLARRVDEKEAQLRDSFVRLGQVERERAIAAERARILRDMHDGVGAHLTTAMRQLEAGKSTRSEVVQTLRESLDQLKLSIDAMNLPPGDVNALLASLRYRLQARIEASGLHLHWEVPALPAWAAGSEDAMRHLQFLLFEAVSNVLQHAHASELTVGARVVDGGIEITLHDNGRGFGATEVKLRSMRERAAALAARFDVSSTAQGTRVGVVLPQAPQ